VKGPPITVSCKCGEVRHVPYGETWQCEKCGRRWNTAQIPAEDYWGIMREMRNYRLVVIGIALGLALAVVTLLAVALGVGVATGAAGLIFLFALALSFGIAWSGISTFIALATRNSESTLMISILTTFPLLFLSTAVMPKPLLPDWVQTVAVYNPISYIADALHRLIITGWDWAVIGGAFLVILVVGAVTLSATTAMFRRAVSG